MGNQRAYILYYHECQQKPNIYFCGFHQTIRKLRGSLHKVHLTQGLPCGHFKFKTGNGDDGRDKVRFVSHRLGADLWQRREFLGTSDGSVHVKTVPVDEPIHFGDMPQHCRINNTGFWKTSGRARISRWNCSTRKDLGLDRKSSQEELSKDLPSRNNPRLCRSNPPLRNGKSTGKSRNWC